MIIMIFAIGIIGSAILITEFPEISIAILNQFFTIENQIEPVILVEPLICTLSKTEEFYFIDSEFTIEPEKETLLKILNRKTDLSPEIFQSKWKTEYG